MFSLTFNINNKTRSATFNYIRKYRRHITDRFDDTINDIDLLKGIIAALMLTVPIIIGLKLINIYAALDAMLEGFKIMIPPLMIVIAAFMFKTINDQLGFPQFIMESVKPFMSPILFPVIVFISMAFMSFATASRRTFYKTALTYEVYKRS